MDEQVIKVGILAVVVAIVAGALVIAVGDRGQVAHVTADTDAQRIVPGVEDSCSIRSPDINVKANGVMPEAGTRPYGEVFTQSTIYFSHAPDGHSQEIVGEAKLIRCNFPAFWPREVRYYFYINTGGGMQPFYQDDIPNGVWTIRSQSSAGFGEDAVGAFSFAIDGTTFCTVPTTAGCPAGKEKDIVDGSVLRVDFHMRFEFIANAFNIFGIRDELTLRSAIASIQFGKEGYVLGEDTKATLSWRAPTATYQDCDARGSCEERPAYYYAVFNGNTGTTVPGFGRQPIPTADGRVEITLTEEMYSNVLATCENFLQAVLYTEIANIDEDYSAIAKLGAGDRPVVESITLSPTDIHEGDVVTISWTIRGNVTSVKVIAEIGGVEVLNVRVNSTATSKTFTASRSGIGSAWVIGYNRCQPSDASEVTFFVGNVYPGLCTVYPDLPQCGAQDALGLLVAAIAAIGAIIVFLLVFWVLSKADFLPGFLNLLLAIVAAGAAAYVLVKAGAFDALLGQARILAYSLSTAIEPAARACGCGG